MLFAECLAKVRVRGEYPSQKEAEYVSRTVLAAFPSRSPKLSEHRRSAVTSWEPTSTLPTVADKKRSATLESARWDVSTVLSTLAETLATHALNQRLTALSPGFASLFGHPETQ